MLGVLVGQLRFLRTVKPDSRTLISHLWSGLLCRCPKCGKGRIFGFSLKVRDECPVCGLSFKAHDAGDGPAVAATFFIGILALAVALVIEFKYEPEMWVHVVVAAPVITLGSYMILRPLKGIMIAMQYRYRSVETEDENLGQM